MACHSQADEDKAHNFRGCVSCRLRRDGGSTVAQAPSQHSPERGPAHVGENNFWNQSCLFWSPRHPGPAFENRAVPRQVASFDSKGLSQARPKNQLHSGSASSTHRAIAMYTHAGRQPRWSMNMAAFCLTEDRGYNLGARAEANSACFARSLAAVSETIYGKRLRPTFRRSESDCHLYFAESSSD